MKVRLNPEQRIVFDKISKERKNIFLTGLSGSGKSTTLKYIFKKLKNKKNIVITSLTGISALLLGGQTIHSYLGIGLGTASFDVLLKKLQSSKFYLKCWTKLEILIIDEVSMLSIDLFEKLERLARGLRRNNLPFGGIQLLLSGDFLQLPTVGSDKFCFESPIWKFCINEIIELKTTMRQKDELFINILNKVRIGKIDEECRQILKSREIEYNSDYGIIPTMLYATNAKVDEFNLEYYNKLENQEYEYDIIYTWFKPCNKEAITNNLRFYQKLNLKVGTQVMYLVNDDPLVNGSRGVVTNFIEEYPEVLFTDGFRKIISPHTLDVEVGDEKIMSYTQIPLRLSWAMSIHKSQGSSLDLLCVDLQNIFEYGQFYVALSRARTLEGLYIRNLDFNRNYTHPKALEFYGYSGRV